MRETQFAYLKDGMVKLVRSLEVQNTSTYQ